MEKRTVLFLVISFVVFMAWDYLFLRQPAKNENQPSVQTNVGAEKKQSSEPVVEKTPAAQSPAIQHYTVKEIETKLFKGIVVKENGYFNKLSLQNFRSSKDHKDLVDIFRAGAFEVYDSLYIDDQPYRVVYSEIDTADAANTITLTLKGTVNDVTIIKKIIMDKNSYLGAINFDVLPRKDIAAKVSVSTVISQTIKSTDSSVEGHPLPCFYSNKSFDTPSERQLKNGYKREKVLYGGVMEKYFSLFFIDPAEITSIDATLRGERTDTIITFFEGKMTKNSPVKIELKYFAGPKDPKILKSLKYHLDNSIDYGFFHFIARPMLIVMDFFYNFTRNYGVSIILLTILVKLAFFPLSHKSYKSMKELQRVQPKMEELRKKHAGDKETLNKEMMALYKRHGVNPLSGCLPMVVQIPFFIALYQALMSAIELRHAPFYLWINDLSAQDPYYVTPILMGATMLLQQILTPSSGDPMQKKIMYLLPVVFTFMFLNFPAGLVLYWLVNNIFSIAQQLYTMKKQEA